MLKINSLQTSRRPVILGYLVAIGSVVAAMIGLWLMEKEWHAPAHLALFLVAVIISAWFGGTKPALFAIALSVVAFDYFLLRPAGSPVVASIQGARLLSFAVVAAYVVWVTITERNAAESLRRARDELQRNNETLRDSERKLKEAEQLARIGYWERDLVADRITTSEETRRILGRQLQSISQAELQEMIHIDDRQLQEQRLTEALEGGGPYDLEVRIVRPDGEVRLLHVRNDEVTYDQSGRPTRMFGTVQDITERKRAEDSLREREALFEVLTENSDDLIRLHELDGRSIYASPAVLRLLGENPANLFDDIHPEDLENGRQWWQHILTGGRDRIEWRVRDIVGVWHWVESRGSIVQYEGKPRVMTVCRDISERKLAEQALRKSERVLREAEELGHTGSWEHDLVTREIFNTDENLRLFFGDDRSKGARFEDYIDAVHPDDRAYVRGRHAQLLAEGGPHDIEFRVVWPDGSLHVLVGRAIVVRNDSGEAIRVYGTNVEITERKKAEQSVQESQQLLELVLATLPVGVAVTDLAGDILLINAASKRIWGDTIVSGRERWAQTKGFWHDSGKRIAPTELASVRALSEGKTSLNELMDIETYDGQQKTIQHSAAPVRNAEGVIVGAVVVNEDVTERVRAEDAVRKNEEQLRDVIDTIPVIAFISMPDGSNEFTNQSWQEYTGLSVKDTAGWGWGSTVHPDDIARHLEKWRAAVSAGTTFDNAARYRGAGGQYRWFLVRAVPLRDERGNLLRWYGVLMDIEDRVHAEQALRKSADRLQLLSRRLLEVQEEERRHLARELHDEFGQLLATITVQLHAAKTLAGESARSIIEECISILQRAGDEVRSLALELRPTMLDTAGLDATLRWLASQHEQRTGIATEVVGHLNEVPGEVAIAAFRVIQEALTNVLRHAQAQHIWIELSQSDGAVELLVRDDGVGFDVPKTLDWAANRGHLGLLGMKERVQILGGHLEVDSKPGLGTRIRLSLPLTEPISEPV
jgi:PAS domain S-box-containing protein